MTQEKDAIQEQEKTETPEPLPEAKVQRPGSGNVSFNTFLIGIAVALIVSSLVSVLAVRGLAKRNMLGIPESSVVTLDTNKLVAAHAKSMGAVANTPEDLQTMNQRFLVGFQKTLETYKAAGITILQSDATVVSPTDVTDQFLQALVVAQKPAAAAAVPDAKLPQ